MPVVAAVPVMEGARGGDPRVPTSMTLMGGPIDTRRSPTSVNNLAVKHSIERFRRHVITVSHPDQGHAHTASTPAS